MTLAPQTEVVDKNRQQTQVFLSYLRTVEEQTQSFTILTLPRPIKGRSIYVLDTSKPAWGDGIIFRYSDGTPV